MYNFLTDNIKKYFSFLNKILIYIYIDLKWDKNEEKVWGHANGEVEGRMSGELLQRRR